jgi:hypothetical protein
MEVGVTGASTVDGVELDGEGRGEAHGAAIGGGGTTVAFLAARRARAAGSRGACFLTVFGLVAMEGRGDAAGRTLLSRDAPGKDA